VDEAHILDVFSGYSCVLVLEEGVRSGGVGEYLAALAAAGHCTAAIESIAFPDAVYGHMRRGELLEAVGLSSAAIARKAASLIKDSRRFTIVKEARL
jgi:1-deoxy-D-xylulose-5-phosphate synthase